MTRIYDYGHVDFEGMEYTLTTQADFTSRLLPAPYTNFAAVAEGEEYDFEMSAVALSPEGASCEVYWILTAIKGQERELDSYDYATVDRVEPFGKA